MKDELDIDSASKEEVIEEINRIAKDITRQLVGDGVADHAEEEGFWEKGAEFLRTKDLQELKDLLCGGELSIDDAH